jgi:hypothetical protein
MKKMIVVGLIVWAAATVALRAAGQYVFRATGTGTALWLLVVSLPLMVWVALAVLPRHRGAGERARAAIALAAPGMLLDAVGAIWFSNIFPNIRPDAAGLFGGWLLFCNVVVLLTAVAWKG